MSKWQIPPKGGHMESADGLYLQNMTWVQITERLKKNDLIIIPVGSTENHGPHACLGEDTFLVTRMAEQVAQKVGCTIAQPIWYGSHPYHHMGMPGTIIVQEEVFCGQLRAVMAGLWNMGFRKQILLNGHGQEYVIPTAIHQFAKLYRVPGVFINLNWYHAIQDQFKLKADGGPYETPFIHADEVETSWSLALFPEFIDMTKAVDTTPRGFMPPGHIDKAGNLLKMPICWYGQVGCGPMEIKATPEGCVGKSTLAAAKKAKPGVEALLNYLEKLCNDIMKTFPAGKLPPMEEVTERDKAEVDAVVKGPLNGGKSIYTLHYPP
ncbi:MAG TPA: 3-dehydro-scyllo-inosose hydrolase [Candidatus Brocadiia bacterium]|nr:3-dehydro-scyllo-inosose hydrolase [Candidatus Brocadiia bacterium]